MLKSIRPGKLRGLNVSRIERSLSNLFGCDVLMEGNQLRIFCVEQYDDPSHLQRDLGKLKNVGEARVACNSYGPHVLVDLNEVAMRVIGETTSEKLIQ